MRKVLLLLMPALLLGACASVPTQPVPAGCPTVTDWTFEDGAKLADELDAAPESKMARAVVEYFTMRDALAAIGCR